MYNVGNYDYQKMTESVLTELKKLEGSFDPEAVKTKSKAAGAFGLWVSSITKLGTVQLDIVPKIEAEGVTAKETTEAFNEKKKSLEEFNAIL